MSKLPNAPLLEVIFEIRWKITNKSDLAKCQYLHGDMFSRLSGKYGFREPLTPVEIPAELLINNPAHRFRQSKGGYPLFQVGPGVITINTIDSEYYWDDFYNKIQEIVKVFFDSYNYNENETFKPALKYMDFYPFDYPNNNILNFLSKSLNISVNQRFFEVEEYPDKVLINISYPFKLGNFNFIINTGVNQEKRKGLVVQTIVKGVEFDFELENLFGWMVEAHDFCSTVFKDMTQGELYESFK